MKARLQIVQWRQHGDDEDSLTTRFFAKDERKGAVPEIRKDYQLNNRDGHMRCMYINADLVFADGNVFKEYKTGRWFRINITEIAEPKS